MNIKASETFEYLRGPGFVLTDDIGMQVAEDLFKLPVKKVQSFHMLEDDPAVNALYNVTDTLRWQLIRSIGDELKPNLQKRYGYTQHDNVGNIMFYSGLGDQDFTWHFAPAIAITVVDTFVTKEFITEEEKNSLTLKDWANVIGSGWFSALIHDMALTRNGTYGSFGKPIELYKQKRIIRNLLPNEYERLKTDDVFVPEWKIEDDGVIEMEYLTASLTKTFRQVLRERMKSHNTTGCPVARHAGTLSVNLINSNPHAARLVDQGHITLGEERNGKVRFTQEVSPIDLSLAALASKLDEYDARYGTPRAEERRNRRKVVHVRQNPSNVLAHPTK